MALDKQRILSELGSVMNQLKSADCGCMGKLFSNQNQGAPMQNTMGSPQPTCGGCGRGCCHGHSYGTPGAHEAYSMKHPTNHSCMGHCNPPKLYADTYNYLTENLMQPVVKDVYNDLKNINPTNTVMNNPLASQMGFSQGNPGVGQGMVGSMSNPMQNMCGGDSDNAGNFMGQSQPPMNAMGGAGPQIVNMMMGASGRKPSNIQRIPAQGGQSATPMGNTSYSTPGNVGAMSMSPGTNQGQYTANVNQQGNMMGFANPPTQFVSKENLYSIEAAQGNPIGHKNQGVVQPGTPQMGAINQIGGYLGTPRMGNMHNAMNPGNMPMTNTNPTVQQMSASNQLHGQTAQGMVQNMNPGGQQMSGANKYGQHTQGVSKFNEIFSGVMQGGDLGFDPMAIAIQMNPANQQKAAMDTMQRLMSGGRGGSPSNRLAETTGNASVLNPVMAATKTAMENINPAPMAQDQQNLSYNQSGNQQITGQQQVSYVPPAQTLNQQMVAPGQQQAVSPTAGVIPPQETTMPQQQVYTAITGEPTLKQQESPKQPLQPQQMQAYQQPPNPNQPQRFVDPSTSATYELDQRGMIHPDTQTLPQTNTPSHQQTYKEPIFPADVSRNRLYTAPKPHHKHYGYNTLGQPIQMLPAKMFHPLEPSLPQTLSPQPPPTKLRNDYLKYSNVKSTVSKTSLAGNKPTGRTPSRSQLQHIYNQYKSSYSLTQQHIPPPVQGESLSEGKMRVLNTNPNASREVPLERVGGDTAANYQIQNVVKNQMMNKADEKGRVGDVPIPNLPQGDGAPLKPPALPATGRQGKLRNGLQDVVYASYPSSAAWSFHGTNTYRPISTGYRYRGYK